MFLSELIVHIERSRKKMYLSSDPSKILKKSQELDKLLIQYYTLKGFFNTGEKDK